MSRVFFGIAFGVLLVMLADQWKTNDMSVSGLLSAVHHYGQTGKLYQN
ncbi:MAG: hypothetical protein WCL27_04210 [Betaproteobacteria bacterium]